MKQGNQQQSSDYGHDVAVLLEIRGEETQGTMRLPVTIFDADRSRVVLRLGHRLPDFVEDYLVNLNANLYLAVPEEPEIVEASGKVAWLKFSGSGHPQMLALELSQAHPKFPDLARRLMLHTKADVKELWERWDKAHQEDVEDPAFNYHAALVLMVGGIVLNLAGPKSSFLLSYLLMLLGGLVAGIKPLLPIRWRRIKSR